MVACSASPRRPKSAPSASWNGLWRKRKGNGRMSRRVGLDHATVVEAAAKLVDEEGIEQLSLGRLAERLGVRTPSLYNHVAGLPGLKHDLALFCSRELLDRLLRATIGKSRAEAIFALANAYRAYATETPGRYAFTVPAPDPGDQALAAVAQQLGEFARPGLPPIGSAGEGPYTPFATRPAFVQAFSSLKWPAGF